jgi:hypothetical protein
MRLCRVAEVSWASGSRGQNLIMEIIRSGIKLSGLFSRFLYLMVVWLPWRPGLRTVRIVQ